MGETIHDALIFTFYKDELGTIKEYLNTLSEEVRKHITPPVLGLNDVATISFLSDGSVPRLNIDAEMQDGS